MTSASGMLDLRRAHTWGEHAFMRIAIDMPASLMRAAKIRAAQRGESLRDLVSRAVAQEVGFPNPPREKAGRVVLPLIGHNAEPAVIATNDDIEATFEKDDVERKTGQ